MTLVPQLVLRDVAEGTAGRIVTGAPETVLTGVAIDSRTIAPGQLFVAVAGPRFDGHEFLEAAAARGATAALVHREVAAPAGMAVVRAADTTRALADLARHVRSRASVPVVAITGSAGKTTTKEMAAALLGTRGPVLKTEGNLNNQYGLPLTLLRLAPGHAAAVLELGMSAAGELSQLTRIARPDVAIITMVAPVHLEFFASVDAIAAAKAEILEGLGPGGVAVLNHDDERVRRIGERFGGRVLWFGRDRACQASAENWRGTVHGMRFDMRLGGETHDVALPLPGPHFMMNFLAAAAAAHHLGLSPAAIAEAATHLTAARHRGEVVRLGQGVTLVDDCYNSNPVAVESAVAALGMAARGRRVAFLGDMLELGGQAPQLHHDTGAAVAPKLDVLVGVGPLAGDLLAGAEARGLRARHAFADSAAAAAAVAAIVQPGDAVLVKGSRGIHMEAVVDALTARFGQAEG